MAPAPPVLVALMTVTVALAGCHDDIVKAPIELARQGDIRMDVRLSADETTDLATITVYATITNVGPNRVWVPVRYGDGCGDILDIRVGGPDNISYGPEQAACTAAQMQTQSATLLGPDGNVELERTISNVPPPPTGPGLYMIQATHEPNAGFGAHFGIIVAKPVRLVPAATTPSP